MPWDPYTDPVNYIILEGNKSPGLADVAGAGSPRKWEERVGYGLSGSTLVYLGRRLANFSVTLRLYSAQDWTDWHAWKGVVERPPYRTRPRSLDIQHPLLDEVQVRSVVVEDVAQPKQISPGEWAIMVKFKEYRRHKNALAKPVASSDKKITDPYEKMTADLTDQFQNLANADD